MMNLNVRRSNSEETIKSRTCEQIYSIKLHVTQNDEHECASVKFWRSNLILNLWTSLFKKLALGVMCNIYCSDKFITLNLQPMCETRNTFITLLCSRLSVMNKKYHITGSCLHFCSILHCRSPWWYLVVSLYFLIVSLDIGLSFLLQRNIFLVQPTSGILIEGLLKWNINDLLRDFWIKMIYHVC